MIEQTMSNDMRAVVLGHLKVIDRLIARVKVGIESAVPITPDGVVIHQANTLEVLQGVSRSQWACRDILEHEQEQPASSGLPPMETGCAADALSAFATYAHRMEQNPEETDVVILRLHTDGSGSVCSSARYGRVYLTFDDLDDLLLKVRSEPL
jgi:hypothetical protein